MRVASLLLPMLLMSIACGGSTAALERENDALRARLAVLEAQTETLRRQVRAAQRPSPPERIELPNDRDDDGTFSVVLVVNGDTYLNGNRVNDSELATLARAAGEGTRAVIAADRDVSYQRVVQIMDILRSNGIEDLALSVQPR